MMKKSSRGVWWAKKKKSDATDVTIALNREKKMEKWS